MSRPLQAEEIQMKFRSEFRSEFLCEKTSSFWTCKFRSEFRSEFYLNFFVWLFLACSLVACYGIQDAVSGMRATLGSNECIDRNTQWACHDVDAVKLRAQSSTLPGQDHYQVRCQAKITITIKYAARLGPSALPG